MDTSKALAKLGAFFATGRERAYARRALILNYGEEADRAYWITKGSVKVVATNKEGSERIQHIYGEHEVFPVKWIFDKHQFDVAFFAFTDTVVRSRPIGEFRTFIEEQPDTLLAIVRQQLAVFANLINLTFESAEQRIAYKLIFLAERFGVYEHAHTILNCPITVQEMAGSIRLSRETTGKILNKFEKQGMVVLGRHHILVYPEKLKQVMND